LYRSSTRGPEDDSVESKHVAPLSHYMLKIPISKLEEFSTKHNEHLNLNF